MISNLFLLDRVDIVLFCLRSIVLVLDVSHVWFGCDNIALIIWQIGLHFVFLHLRL